MSTIGKTPRRLDVNVNGTRGSNGSDGSSGMRGSSGSDGADGTNATAPTSGARAGDIDAQLRVRAKNDGFETEAVINTGKALGADQPAQVLPYGTDLYLTARGGDGGHGARGGDGGDGGDGSDGSDATRYSTGSSGDDGGDGGDGGYGTSGADGGDGGRIRVRVSGDDTDALASVKALDVGAGDGGRAGVHGQGGARGDGGDGGDSYSWSETDSEGKTESGTNSGGSDGSDGRVGDTPSSTLSSGSAGKAGSAVLEVVDAAGQVQTFADRYRMQGSDAKLRDQNADGVFEPGERLELDVKYRNAGPMTSPKAPLRTEVTGDWLTQTAPRALGASITPGSSTEVTGVGLKLNDAPLKTGAPLNTSTAVRSAAVAERVGAVLNESVVDTPLTVQYPVEISAVVGDRTATRDRPAQISWEVKNISTKPLGTGSDSQRVVQSMLKATGGDLAAAHLIFTNAKGERGSVSEAIGQAMANLAPGQSVKIEGKISFGEHAPFYTQVSLAALLDVGALDAPANAKSIQAREFSVQLAQTYANDPDAGLLLVSNNRTTREELKAWEQLAQELGTKVNVWNLSLYGGMSLTRAMGNADLGAAFAKKTVVMLNNAFDPEKGATSPIGQLGEKDLLLAAVKNRSSTYVVGGDVDVEAQLFAPSSGGKTFDEDGLSDALEAGSLGSDVPLGSDTISVSARGAPSKEKLDEAAAEVREQLAAHHPERRYVVETNYAPKKDDSFFSFVKTQSVGSVTVRRGADVDQNVVVHQRADDVHAPAFVLSAQNRYGLAKSLSLPLKLQALDRLSQKPNDPNAPVVLRALLSDLAEEQQALRTQDGTGKLSREVMAEKLGDLREVAAHFTQVSPSTPRGQLVLDLIAEVQHMTEQAKTTGDKLLPMRRRSALDEVSDGIVETLMRNAFGGTAVPSIRQALETRKAALEKRDAGQSEAQRLAMTSLLRPNGLWAESITTDFDAGRK